MSFWNITTTPCLNPDNEMCLSDEDYLDDIISYAFPQPYEWVAVVLYIIVFIIGLVGNSLVCFAIWRNKNMRTVTNIFIVNLAVADFAVILICLPSTCVEDLAFTFFMGKVMCKVVKYFQPVSVCVSVLTLTVISIERWWAICHPLRFKSTTSRARNIIIVIWIVSLLIPIPDVIAVEISSIIPPKYQEMTVLLTRCQPAFKQLWDTKAQTVYQIFLTVVMFLIPLVLMAFAYSRIARCLWVDAVPGGDEENRGCNAQGRAGASARDSQLQSRKNVAKMLIAVVVMFAVCYLPVYLLNILRYAKVYPRDKTNEAHSEVAGIVMTAAHWLCFFNSAINPVIYNFMSAKFRNEFKTVCCACCVRLCPGSIGRRYRYGNGSAYSYKSAKTFNSSCTENITLNTMHTDVTAA